MSTRHLDQNRFNEMVRCAIKEFPSSIPVEGKEEGWRRIEKRLYSGNERCRMPANLP